MLPPNLALAGHGLQFLYTIMYVCKACVQGENPGPDTIDLGPEWV